MPKLKPAYSPDLDKGYDYDVVGAMEESDDADGCADAVDIESAPDDDDDDNNNGCDHYFITDGFWETSSHPADDGTRPEIRRHTDR